MRPEILGKTLGDMIIAEIQVAAAPFAHGGGRRHGHVQFSAALETDHALLFERGRRQLGRRMKGLGDAKMRAALLTNAGISRARLRLRVTAFGAGHRNRIHFERHLRSECACFGERDRFWGLACSRRDG